MLNRKIIRAKQAKEWTENMQKNYVDEIHECIQNTRVYDGSVKNKVSMLKKSLLESR